MLRNMKVGAKLLAVLIAPLVVLAVLAAVGINDRLAEASDAEQVESLTELAALNAATINDLELEMDLAAATLGGKTDAGPGPRLGDYQAQVAKTDERLPSLQQSLADVDTDGDENFETALSSAETRIEDLNTVRTGVEGDQFDTQVAINQYLETIDALLDVNFNAAQAAKTPALADALENFVRFGEGKRFKAEQVSWLSGVSETSAEVFFNADNQPCTDPEAQDCISYRSFVDSGQDGDDVITDWTDQADPDEKSLYRNATSAPEVRQADDMISQAFTLGAENQSLSEADGGWDRDTWLNASLDKINALFTVEAGDQDNSLVRGVLADAGDLRSQADREVRVFILVTVVAIAVSLGLALLVARAVARPLQQLTEAANTLSTERLPSLVEQLRNPEAEGVGGFAQDLAPIDIHSKDEIGQLADAFNSIQQVTVEVAEEQAQLLRKGIGDIFINLARRNQTLLDRQIEFIDQLEANEEDPDQLDNLFKLDHLATRMRRNAESLLVLAGAEPPRRRGKPVALADVVRVAIGEVEDFARISLLALDDAMVGGNVAVDLAHLLSELMENATHFSPPDTHVEVVGHVAPDGGYTISVTDQGIGMSGEQLAEANHLLSNPPLVGLALSRSLGFIVIGRLAARFDIAAELTASPSGGITALVKLPRDVVTDADGQPLPMDAEAAAALEAAAEPEVVEEVEAPGDYELAEAPADEFGAEPELVDEGPTLEVDAAEEVADEVVETTTYEEPATFDEAVPEGDDFERGLESIISGDAPPGPIEADEPGLAPSEPESESAFESESDFDVAADVEAESFETESFESESFETESFASESFEPEPEPEPEVAEPEVAEPEPVFESGFETESFEPEPEPVFEPEPEPVVIESEPEPELEPEFETEVSVGASAEDSLVDAAPASPPPAAGEMTAAGLVKRTPKKRSEGGVGGGPLRTAATAQRPSQATKRSPEEVRKMLSRYRGGLKKGRDDPSEDG